MDEQWQVVIEQLKALGEKAGIPLPAAFQPGTGREPANVWLKEKVRLDTLAGFLAEVEAAWPTASKSK